MNIRLQKYKKNRLKGMNGYNAAIAAGFSQNYAKQACRIDKLVKDSMADVLEQAGLTDKFLAKYLKKGLRAKKLYGKKGIKYADWGARHRFFETGLKMADKLKADVEINTGDVVTVRNEIVYVFSGSRKEVEANARKRERDKEGVQSLHDSEGAGGHRCKEAV